jgi:outer membrane protein TolC
LGADEVLSGCASKVLGGCASKVLAGFACIVLASPAWAQPQPAERVTFDEAVRRAVERHPAAAIAASGILRAEALLTQTRSAARLQVAGSLTTTTLNRGVEFEGTTVTPRSSLLGTLDVRMPLYAPAQWARRAQAADQVEVATLSAAETRRQTALATADAYLAILARRRVVEANVRARDVARAHFDLATELERGGTGSRLNRIRAEQELSTVVGVVESAQLALYRAQEALGVLLVADGPVDASEEPRFEEAAAGANVGSGFSGTATATDAVFRSRIDIRLFLAQQSAAERVLDDTRTEYRPYFEAIFQPATTYPSQFFTPQNSWRFMTQLTMPLVDSGRRAGQRVERQAAVDRSRATVQEALTVAASEARVAREAVASTQRALASAQAAAAQAQEVVDIVNVSFRAGAATNIEVIDAERRARDADTQVAVAEDALRRARLELLIALGQFPR